MTNQMADEEDDRKRSLRFKYNFKYIKKKISHLIKHDKDRLNIFTNFLTIHHKRLLSESKLFQRTMDS